MSVTPVLELRDASIGYEGRPVVDRVSFTVTSGEVVAILGANGSGKSTLVRGVLGLAQHLAGEIDAFGTPIGQLHERWRLGYVPQRDTLARGIPATVREVVASGRLAHSRPWRRTSAAGHARIHDAIAVVGLEGRERTLVTELSGGQQRRVLVARALAGDAELLILDEPTAGVDAENQQVLADTMATLAAAGTTILLVAHELGPAASIVSRVLLMSAGHLAYDGEPRQQDTHGSDHHHLAEADAPGRFGLAP
jgi:zinc transport system ATP-binding protein